MKQPKRILALLGAVLLAGMYVCTLVFALMKSELAQTLFRASLGCTILVPVLLYAFLLAARMLRPAKSPLVDNVIFDLGNVLIDFGWEELARKNGMTDADIGVMKEKVVGSSYWEVFDYSRIPYEEAAERFCAELPELADRLRPTLMHLEDCFSVYSYAESWIAELRRKGYGVYFLSNWSETIEKRLEENGTMAFLKAMDGGLWSWEIRDIKPHPAVYRAFLARYGLDPERCVFLDDSEKNVEGARNCGIRAIRFQNYDDAREKLAGLGVK